MFFRANASQKPHLYFGIGSPNLAKLLGLGQNRNSWSTQPCMTESVVPPLPPDENQEQDAYDRDET